MTPQEREAMQMALDALEKHVLEYETVEALRARLAQPEPEPVAWLYEGSDIEGRDVCLNEDIFEEQKPNCIPLYTAPPQQPEQEPINYEEWNYNPMTGKPLWDKQPEPEPVAWFMEGTFEDGTPSFTQVCETDPEFYVPLYNAPPQREWQGLTDEERTFLAWESNNGPECVAMTEAKLKEKNGF